MEKQTETSRETLLALAHEASPSPGVYLMRDTAGAVIYVGKAKSLKNRLSTYFQPAVHESPRTEMMVNRVARFDVILTETEAEALILEATLVKKHKPKFNVRLKDDKAYPYLKIQVDQDFPKIEWTRRVLRDGARYFGPFPSSWSARQVMQMLNETFHLRDCSENTFRNRSRPCILHQIGKCSGSCVGLVSRDEYKEHMAQAISVLEGKTDRLIGELQEAMARAAEKEEYELAAEYRDQILNLQLITETQSVIYAEDPRNRDVVGLARKEADAHGTILRVRSGKLVAVQHYHLQNTDPSIPEGELVSEFVSQYYLSLGISREAEEAEEGLRPAEVLVPSLPQDAELLERTLGMPLAAGHGAVDEQLLGVARANAQYALEQSLKRAAGHGIQSLEEIQEKLHLPRLPRRIECYDISNIQGQDSVASRVVFIDGSPEKNLYRRYKIRTVEGANDFASMKEVLGRRFSHSPTETGEPEEQYPDLVVVDGGKGQLAQAVAILGELGIEGVDVVGLAKARTERDFQAKEVKSTMERIFIPNRKNPVALLPSTGAYRLLVHVRDEAHRFAVSYHRVLRSKRSLRSEEA